MPNNPRLRFYYPAIICALIALAIGYFYFFAPLSKEESTTFLYIDADDNIDSVFAKIDRVATGHGRTGFHTMARHTSYANNIRTGRYAVEPGEGPLTVFRRMKNGMQTPVSLTIPSVRTADKLAAHLGRKLMVDSTDVINALRDEATCERLGYDTATIVSMFIPNTYDIYWNITLEKLLERMQTECNHFWNAGRMSRATALGLKPTEVVTLASIVDEETSDDGEKPMIAGMYYNRLQMGMPLQADPTIKFALKQFELKRIWNNLLNVNSPYNTYRNTGLPPGPIRIPTVAGIDAVLNLVRHDYLYMCAKEDFSGTHNFARTYQEHLQNAAKYSKALNERGIK